MLIARLYVNLTVRHFNHSIQQPTLFLRTIYKFLRDACEAAYYVDVFRNQRYRASSFLRRSLSGRFDARGDKEERKEEEAERGWRSANAEMVVVAVDGGRR